MLLNSIIGMLFKLSVLCENIPMGKKLELLYLQILWVKIFEEGSFVSGISLTLTGTQSPSQILNHQENTN